RDRDERGRAPWRRGARRRPAGSVRPCRTGTRSTPSGRRRSSRDRLERPPAVLGCERLGEVAEIALEDLVEPVLRQLDAMVGDPALGVVVGADLLGPLARAD